MADAGESEEHGAWAPTGRYGMMPVRYEDATADLLSIEPTEIRQLVPAHRPGEGRIGDCYRACIASMLGCSSAEDVPHFIEWSMDVEAARGSRDPKGGWEAFRLARIWLRENRDIDLMTVTLEAAQRYGVPYMLSVQSKTGPWSHCVVAIGGEVWWDPSGVGGYSLADAKGDAGADVLCTPYAPDPDETVRQWALATIAEMEAAATEREEADRAKDLQAVDIGGDQP